MHTAHTAASIAASMPLHERALCTLYDAPGFASDGAARSGRLGGSRARRGRRKGV